MTNNRIHSGGYLTAVVIKGPDKEPTILADLIPNVLADTGRDQFHANCYTSTSLSGSAFNWVALTENTAQTVNSAQTTLTAEIVTNGLQRAQATTRNHSAGTNSTLIEHTHTASGAFTDVVRSALFNASSAGIMSHFAAYATGSGTLAVNDTLKTSWTLNLG